MCICNIFLQGEVYWKLWSVFSHCFQFCVFKTCIVSILKNDNPKRFLVFWEQQNMFGKCFLNSFKWCFFFPHLLLLLFFFFFLQWTPKTTRTPLQAQIHNSQIPSSTDPSHNNLDHHNPQQSTDDHNPQRTPITKNPQRTLI